MNLAKLLASIPAPLVGLIVDLVNAILAAPDSKLAVRRAKEATMRVAAVEAAKKAKPRRP